jgi:hypothetical protein
MNRDDWKVIIGGAIFAAFVFFSLYALAFAGEPRLPFGNCEAVRSAVAEHGRIAAVRWAREHGYTWSQIAEARKCLR